MSLDAATLERRPSAGYHHEAAFYLGTPGFLEATVAFVKGAVARDEPVLVAVSAAKIALLRQHLGTCAAAVTFADMGEIGANPGRIIAAWQDFVAEHRDAPGLCGIGEPISPERAEDELAECHLHESLLNLAFDDATPLWLRCPYDVAALEAAVVREAHRTHPIVVDGSVTGVSDAYVAPDLHAPFARPLSPAPAGAVSFCFGADQLAEVRGFVESHARRCGCDAERAGEIVLAVDELATNSVTHGGGSGILRYWLEGPTLVFEVEDRGTIRNPLVGRVLPPAHCQHGRGLWIANQLCDLVQIHSSEGCTAVRVRLGP